MIGAEKSSQLMESPGSTPPISPCTRPSAARERETGLCTRTLGLNASARAPRTRPNKRTKYAERHTMNDDLGARRLLGL